MEQHVKIFEEESFIGYFCLNKDLQQPKAYDLHNVFFLHAHYPSLYNGHMLFFKRNSQNRPSVAQSLTQILKNQFLGSFHWPKHLFSLSYAITED